MMKTGTDGNMTESNTSQSNDSSSQTSRREYIQGAAAAGTIGITGLAGCLDVLQVDSEDEWSLGTSSEGSSSFQIGSTWTEYMDSEDLLDTEIEPIVTEGTGASYRRLDQGEFEISGTTTQLLEDSPDEGDFEDEPLEDFDSIRQVRGYMAFYNFGVYNAEEVSGWDDLEDRPIAISSAGSGTRSPVEWLVDQEIGMDNIDNRYMAFADIPAALRDGTVDAAFTWTVNEDDPTGWLQEIDETVDWEPLEFSDSTIQSLDEDLAYSTYHELDEETVGEFSDNWSDPVDSFTLTYLYVVKEDADPDLVYDIAEMTHEHGEDLLDQNGAMDFFPDPDMFLGTLHPDVPFHQGAYEYYQNAGFWDDYDLTPPPEEQ
ncbi:hypothetical protein K0C01_12355 [Salinarchaeum sp. IM2453]|uniref:TAXI family TRAP transporter solute-binding subunit n=1 Tax=Salinarchaeum sp. IM2453 TaxID=2862870 RepID=UPI001C83C514|nr:TAXI family TRAP transporter solute-binding subunit [Salinarchaeum sp. IM2453]QZA88553.1 hypothetical protein K0C01_12355 [Salinarchaeum sp. IM2453]